MRSHVSSFQLIGPHVVITLPLILLIAINALPIAGALLLDWNLYTLLLMYWAENAIIGLYTLPKILSASKRGTFGNSRSYECIFFVTHYSTFWVLHGVALVTVFQISGSQREGSLILFFATLILYIVHHGVSHRMNWRGRTEHDQMSPTGTMLLPYVRVLGVFLLSIVGGIAVWRMGDPPMALAVLAATKIGVDAATHVLIHRALAAPIESATE